MVKSVGKFEKRKTSYVIVEPHTHTHTTTTTTKKSGPIKHKLKRIAKNRILRVADYIINEYGTSLSYSEYKKLVLEKTSQIDWEKFRGALRLKFAKRVERISGSSSKIDVLIDNHHSDFLALQSGSCSDSDDLLNIDKKRRNYVDFHLLKECLVKTGTFPWTRTKRVWIPYTILIREGVLEYFEDFSENRMGFRKKKHHPRDSLAPRMPKSLNRVMSSPSNSHLRSIPPRPISLQKALSQNTGLDNKNFGSIRRTSSSNEIGGQQRLFVLLKHFELSKVNVVSIESDDENDERRTLYTFTIDECVDFNGKGITLRIGGYTRANVDSLHETLRVLSVTKSYIRRDHIFDLHQIGKGSSGTSLSLFCCM